MEKQNYFLKIYSNLHRTPRDYHVEKSQYLCEQFMWSHTKKSSVALEKVCSIKNRLFHSRNFLSMDFT
ncbi:hypothetical protein J6TS7_34700 [Paenibacillus dendritiformis]|nr:hypothetical protein J6TS7_34700 [Paenibacillus dendritiformis]